MHGRFQRSNDFYSGRLELNDAAFFIQYFSGLQFIKAPYLFHRLVEHAELVLLRHNDNVKHAVRKTGLRGYRTWPGISTDHF